MIFERQLRVHCCETDLTSSLTSPSKAGQIAYQLISLPPEGS